jgi:hypothetical protein
MLENSKISLENCLKLAFKIEFIKLRQNTFYKSEIERPRDGTVLKITK